MAEDRDEAKRRTEVKDLPRPEKELSAEEQKDVKGGAGWVHSVEGGHASSTGPGLGSETTEPHVGYGIPAKPGG